MYEWKSNCRKWAKNPKSDRSYWYCPLVFCPHIIRLEAAHRTEIAVWLNWHGIPPLGNKQYKGVNTWIKSSMLFQSSASSISLNLPCILLQYVKGTILACNYINYRNKVFHPFFFTNPSQFWGQPDSSNQKGQTGECCNHSVVRRSPRLPIAILNYITDYITKSSVKIDTEHAIAKAAFLKRLNSPLSPLVNFSASQNSVGDLLIRFHLKMKRRPKFQQTRL
jgi:hypothetical protein